METLAPLASQPAGEALRIARALNDEIVSTYGTPSSGPLYDDHLRYLVEPGLHDFRFQELPALTGDAAVLQSPKKILDLGCGPGLFVLRGLSMGHDARGIDLSETKVALSKAWAAERGFGGDGAPRFTVDDAGDLPFDDESFDLVSSYHVLEHVSDLRSVLYEAVRVTKRGGWLQLCAPDYRMSYDTHYCMPWPRFMPPKQAEQWTKAMGRPATGIGTFFYITAPEVTALLQALGCRVHALVMRTHYRGQVRPWDGNLTVEPIVFRSDREVADYAAEIKRLQQQNALPPMYETCLEFTIAAQRL